MRDYERRFWLMDELGNLTQAKDIDDWSQKMEWDHTQIELTGNDDIYVSTVFLGIDHNWGFEDEKRPILFETMVFGGEYDELQFRYCTIDEARAGHKDVCWRVFHKVGVKSEGG
jgi:hypothetical protein